MEELKSFSFCRKLFLLKVREKCSFHPIKPNFCLKLISRNFHIQANFNTRPRSSLVEGDEGFIDPSSKMLRLWAPWLGSAFISSSGYEAVSRGIRTQSKALFVLRFYLPMLQVRKYMNVIQKVLHTYFRLGF